MFAVAVSELANQILLARALLFFGYTERGREGGREGEMPVISIYCKVDNFDLF
jgi:hypothetical protein